MPRRTPTTMPAIAPGERPLLVVVELDIPEVEPPEVGMGVEKAVVKVGVPVEVTVATALEVGRMAGVPDAKAVTEARYELEKSFCCGPEAAHCPGYWQYWPTAQHIPPQDDSPTEVSHVGYPLPAATVAVDAT